MINLPTTDIFALTGSLTAVPDQQDTESGTIGTSFLEIMAGNIAPPEVAVDRDTDTPSVFDVLAEQLPDSPMPMQVATNNIPEALVISSDVVMETEVSLSVNAQNIQPEHATKTGIALLDTPKPVAEIPEGTPDLQETKEPNARKVKLAPLAAVTTPDSVSLPEYSRVEAVETHVKPLLQTIEEPKDVKSAIRSAGIVSKEAEVQNAMKGPEHIVADKNMLDSDRAEFVKIETPKDMPVDIVRNPGFPHREAQVSLLQGNSGHYDKASSDDMDIISVAPRKPKAEPGSALIATPALEPPRIEPAQVKPEEFKTKEKPLGMAFKSETKANLQPVIRQLDKRGINLGFPTEPTQKQVAVPLLGEPDNAKRLATAPKEAKRAVSRPIVLSQSPQVTDAVAIANTNTIERQTKGPFAHPFNPTPDRQQNVDEPVSRQPDMVAETTPDNIDRQAISKLASQSQSIPIVEMAATIPLSTEVDMPDAIEALDPIDLPVSETRNIESASARIETAVSRPEIPRHMARQLADVARQMPDRPVELTLNPDELGRVRLTFTLTDGGINVAVLVERGETMDLMRRHIETLAQEFRDMGYSDVKFQFSQNGQGESGGGNSTPDRNPADNLPRQEIGTITPAKLTLEPPAGLDLRL